MQKIINLHAVPVVFVAGDELFVQLVHLINVMAGRIVEDDGQANAVGVVDDLAWRHRGLAGPDMTNGGNGAEISLGVGDQLVALTVEIPASLTPRARELIEELGRELGEDVQPQQQGFLEKLRGLFG